MKEGESMNDYKTELLPRIENLPTLLEFKRLAHLRELLTPKEKQIHLREEKGAVGENIVSDFLDAEGSNHWTIIRNTWLFDDSPFECDMLLLTNHGIHTIEIKHYTGCFTYKNGSCSMGNLKMAHDCVQQARKSFLKLNKLCRHFQPNVPVNGLLLFSSNKNKIVIESPIADINVFEMPDFYEYLKKVIKEEENNPYPPFNHQQLLHYLKPFEIKNPFYPKAITEKQMQNARKGIYCALCKSFDVGFSRHFIECPCGYHESREEGIVRAACDYGVLTYDRHFSIGDILAFIDHQASSVFVQKTLKKHFTMVDKNKHTYYKNKMLDYSNIVDQFDYRKASFYYAKGFPDYHHNVFTQ